MNNENQVIHRLTTLLEHQHIDTINILSRRTTHDVVGIEPSEFNFAKSFKRLQGHMADLEITPVAVVIASDTGMNAVQMREATALAENMAVLVVSNTELGVPPSVFML